MMSKDARIAPTTSRSLREYSTANLHWRLLRATPPIFSEEPCSFQRFKRLSLDFVGRADDFVGRADGFFRKSHQHRNKREVRLKSQIFDPGRTRTYNLRFRRPMPYPLGHRASRGLKTESVKLMLQGTVSSVDRTPRPGIESGSSA